MKPTEKCAQCFAADASIISHWAFSAEIAAKIYGSIHANGYLPAMCQQDEGKFFVCYERGARSAQADQP